MTKISNTEAQQVKDLSKRTIYTGVSRAFFMSVTMRESTNTRSVTAHDKLSTGTARTQHMVDNKFSRKQNEKK